jgi:hypothetical protein
MTLVLPPSSFQPEPSADEPLLAVGCPSCHGALSVAAALAGAAARCPLCFTTFLVPLPAWQPPAEESYEPVAPGPRGELEFQEPVTTLTSGDELIELRRLTPEEKAARRARRNLIMLLTGVSILMTIVFFLGTKRPKK